MDQFFKDNLQANISNFNPEVRKFFKTIPQNNGILASEDVREVIKILNISLFDLMVQLLPVAGAFAVTPISKFNVGAIAAGLTKGSGFPNLYFGGNFEFIASPLSLVVHAEQSAIINAWHNGEIGVSALAITAEPCGYCRQFLYELSTAENLEIVIPKSKLDLKDYTKTLLPKLLPNAFGPQELGVKGGLMADERKLNNFQLKIPSQDKLVSEALHAANNSYAPYSEGYAGCAIITESSRIFKGRYAENAAFNPSISPMQAALVCMNLSSQFKIQERLLRVVLVETNSAITSQLGLTKLLLKTVAPDLEVEFFNIEK